MRRPSAVTGGRDTAAAPFRRRRLAVPEIRRRIFHVGPRTRGGTGRIGVL